MSIDRRFAGFRIIHCLLTTMAVWAAGLPTEGTVNDQPAPPAEFILKAFPARDTGVLDHDPDFDVNKPTILVTHGWDFTLPTTITCDLAP